MSSLKKTIVYLLGLYSIFFNTASLANISNYKFYAGQVHDAQRQPAFPVANTPFQLSYLQSPYSANSTHYTLNAGEYIQLFYPGGTCKDGQVGINRYDSKGNLIETVQPTGHIYGLNPVGFLHDNKNIGTFISVQFQPQYSSLIYKPATGPTPETCAKLKAYKLTQANQKSAINVAQPLAPQALFEEQVAEHNQRLQEYNEILAKRDSTLNEYEQQINQLNQKLNIANKLQELQVDYIKTLERKLEQSMQLLREQLQ